MTATTATATTTATTTNTATTTTTTTTISALSVLALLCLLPASGAAAESHPAASAPKHSPTVTLGLGDPSPVIGVTGETELRIEVTQAPESPMPMPRLLCSAGQIEDLGREGPTTFTARFILPSGRFPQPTILVAEFGVGNSPLRGVLPVRLRAAATPTLRTDPGAQVTLRVGDRDFGPQTALADGVVNIPVVVPPGVDSATARSVNQHGKTTEQILDLRVPYSQRLLIVAPEALAAGSVNEVAVYAVEPTGQPANAAAIVMRAQGARVQPLGSRVMGEARFLVTAPSILKERSLRIEAQLKGQSTTRVATRVPLVAGRAASLALEPEAPHLARDGRTGLRVFLGAQDSYGNPVDAARADILVDSRIAPVKTGDSGDPLVLLFAPPGSGRNEVVVEGVLDDAHATRRIPVGARRSLLLARPAAPRSPRYTLTPRLGILWNLGAAAGATFFIDATAYRIARYPNLGMGLSLGALQSWFWAESSSGITETSLTTLPVLFELRRRFIMGRGFVAVGGGAGFAFSIGRLRSFGATVTGHGYGAALQAAIESGFVLGDAHLAFSLRYLSIYLTELSSGDRIVGNAAGVVADLGYRLVW